MDQSFASLLASIALVIIVILLCRELACWYFKINTIKNLLEEQNKILRKAFNIDEEKEETKQKK